MSATGALGISSDRDRVAAARGCRKVHPVCAGSSGALPGGEVQKGCASGAGRLPLLREGKAFAPNDRVRCRSSPHRLPQESPSRRPTACL